MILQHRLKAKPDFPKIEVIKTYGELPLIECYVGQLNQVFMNILSNAIDALEERQSIKHEITNDQLKNPSHPLFAFKLNHECKSGQNSVDNGPAVPESVRSRLFDPFFTAKPVGKGTGLGMSISYQIVTEKHKGSIQCFSTLGCGAEFMIEIPVRQQQTFFK